MQEHLIHLSERLAQAGVRRHGLLTFILQF